MLFIQKQFVNQALFYSKAIEEEFNSANPFALCKCYYGIQNRLVIVKVI